MEPSHMDTPPPMYTPIPTDDTSHSPSFYRGPIEPPLYSPPMETTPLLPGINRIPNFTPHKRCHFITSTVLTLIALVVVSFELIRFIMLIDAPFPTNISVISGKYTLQRSTSWKIYGHRTYIFSLTDKEIGAAIPFAELKHVTAWSKWWWYHDEAMDMYEFGDSRKADSAKSHHQSPPCNPPLPPDSTSHVARTWLEYKPSGPDFHILFGLSLNPNIPLDPNAPLDFTTTPYLQSCAYSLWSNRFDWPILMRQCSNDKYPTRLANVSDEKADKGRTTTFYDQTHVYAVAIEDNEQPLKRAWDVEVKENAPFPPALVGILISMRDAWDENEAKRILSEERVKEEGRKEAERRRISEEWERKQEEWKREEEEWESTKAKERWTGIGQGMIAAFSILVLFCCIPLCAAA